ncbi:acyl-CoA dehydrogenase family protein [Microbacterium trichothecenolyticum]|uniref:acyl-CoA dehydrogenase family protein n=1 Tax=Microbacterium trichothecenolyticum TaxID=69370 RepID=UPI0035BE712B
MTAVVTGADLGVLAPVRAFDAFLGDPADDDAVISTRRSVLLDERSALPEDELAAVTSFGLQRWYIPAAHGGALTDALVPLLMIRHLARRDFTVAAAHGKTFLGGICAWVADGSIATRMARLVETGRPVSWGLTERGRGSDLSRSATTAQIGAGSVRVDGGKWPINNAIRCRAMTVLARSDERGGPRSLSLVLVDKDEADPATIGYEPKVSSHGLRGANLAGIRFEGSTVGSDAVVGPEGHGLELVLKSLQLTRPFTTGLSMGAVDRALNTALDAAAVPDGARGRLLDAPVARRALGVAVADALLVECLMLVGVRSAHAFPGEMALVSALVKFLGPDTADLLFRDLTRLLGARALVVGTEGAGALHPSELGAFQKAARDSRVVGIFDGNSVVNLNMIVNELPNQLRPAAPPPLAEVLAPLRADAQFEALDTTALRLVTRHGSRLLRSLPALVDAIDDGRTSRAAVDAARRIGDEYAALLAEAEDLPRQSQPDPLAFHLAERFALVFGGACALAVHLARARAIPGPLGESDAWLAAVLQRVANRLGADPVQAPVADALLDAAVRVHEAGATVTLLDSWTERS